ASPLHRVLHSFPTRRSSDLIAGRVETGTLRVGDQLVFSPANKSSVVATIERWNAPANGAAMAGDSIGITLAEQIFVERGQKICSDRKSTRLNSSHVEISYAV